MLNVDLTAATQVSNNLGGTGPDFTDPCNCLRYNNAGTYLSESVDLVVKLVDGTGYNAPTSAGRNVMLSGQGRLSVRQGEYVDVELWFEYSSGSPAGRILLPTVYVTLLDLERDHKRIGKIEEYVEAEGFAEIYLSPNTKVVQGSGARYSSRFSADSWSGVENNPTDMLALTDEQRDLAVMLRYEETDEVRFRFGITSGNRAGNIFFAFRTNVYRICESPTLPPPAPPLAPPLVPVGAPLLPPPPPAAPPSPPQQPATPPSNPPV